jgi:hypothetical protein
MACPAPDVTTVSSGVAATPRDRATQFPRAARSCGVPRGSSYCPGAHQWLDPARYRRHVDSVADLHPDTVATAHGPLLTGDAIGDAFDRVRAMAAAPRVMPPGQSALDELIAATVLGRAAA